MQVFPTVGWANRIIPNPRRQSWWTKADSSFFGMTKRSAMISSSESGMREKRVSLQKKITIILKWDNKIIRAIKPIQNLRFYTK